MMIERINDDEYYEIGICYLFSVVNVWIECWIDTIVLTIIMLL